MSRASTIYSLSSAGVGSVRVDRSGRGTILGAAIMSPGEARGHGFSIDEVSLSQVVGLGEGIQGRWTHPSPFSDGLGSFLGRWRRVRLEGGKAVGDFEFSEAAHQYHPQGLTVSAAEWLMARAEQDPDVLGVSIVAELDVESLGEETALRHVARIRSLSAADFVADPAANESLFQTGGQMTRVKLQEPEAEDEEAEEAPVEEAAPEEVEAEEAPAEEEPEPEPEAEEEPEEESLSDKVSALEDRIAALEGQLSEAEEANASLRSEVDVYRLAAASAKQARQVEFLSYLGERSASLQSPIPAKDIALVEARFSAGDDEGARAIGEAFLARSAALAATKGAGALRDLGPTKLDAQRETTQQTARYLREGGLTVELSEDGTRITKQRRTR